MAAVSRLSGLDDFIATCTKETVGWASTCSVASAEAKAIALGIEAICSRISWKGKIWIFTDSKAILRQRERRRGCATTLEAVQQLLLTVEKAAEDGWKVEFRWIPAHRDIDGNTAADALAKTMTQPGLKPSRDPLIRIRERKAVATLIDKDIRQAQKAKFGAYRYTLDRALPAAALAQARTVNTFFQSFQARIDRTTSPACECGASREDVHRVMLTRGVCKGRPLGHDKATGRIKPLTGKLLDGPKEKWAANVRVVKASIEFLKQNTRIQAPSTRFDEEDCGPRPSQTNTIDNYFVSLTGTGQSVRSYEGTASSISLLYQRENPQFEEGMPSPGASQ
ncbi:hypothetical protein KVT40_001627 [Elsinoe batatas]|uniref:RNase H type-1 domain-containing protein n=1 Tax=Elsinoe batatas TaxID=2601811 RepID=A0A8K0LD35_9PEZI|nr:hypothetical protein KVT40_001627 [Elsinoe batatas]